MRIIILTLILLNITVSTNAKSGDMGGGRSSVNPFISIDNSAIEAVISKSGIYSRLIDLQEGFEQFEGVSVSPTKTRIEFNPKKQPNLESIIFTNGKEFDLRKLQEKVQSGDMGGG